MMMVGVLNWPGIGRAGKAFWMGRSFEAGTPPVKLVYRQNLTKVGRIVVDDVDDEADEDEDEGEEGHHGAAAILCAARFVAVKAL